MRPRISTCSWCIRRWHFLGERAGDGPDDWPAHHLPAGASATGRGHVLRHDYIARLPRQCVRERDFRKPSYHQCHVQRERRHRRRSHDHQPELGGRGAVDGNDCQRAEPLWAAELDCIGRLHRPVGGSNWLYVTPSSGSSTTPSVSVSGTGTLPPGGYTAMLTFTAGSASASIPIVYNVTRNLSSDSPSVTFTGVTGQSASPSARLINVTSSLASTTYTTAITYGPNAQAGLPRPVAQRRVSSRCSRPERIWALESSRPRSPSRPQAARVSLFR